MQFVIIGIFLFVVALIPGVEQKIESALSGVSGALTSGPTKEVFKYWLIAGGVLIVAGGGIWYLENRYSEHSGGGHIAPPPVAPHGLLPAPPSFSGSGGLGFDAGPVRVDQKTGATSGGFARRRRARRSVRI
jgi:hypothetical protein